MKVHDSRADEILAHCLHLKRVATDRQFFWILLLQWAAAVVLTLIISPYSWEGNTKIPHIHLEAAVIIGGLLNALPLVLISVFPGWWVTRHVVAATQMLWSAFLIHLTGGRIETHFHVFVSLAFLALYVDWSVFITATVLVAADHLLRGLLWPESVYGTLNPEWWRFLEHAGWVVFEDIVLILGCRRTLAEMTVGAGREALLETINFDIEQQVKLRTQELTVANESLASEMQTRAKMEGELVDVSRRAGMAEVATSVLHNVGNVLNSVNVSASLALDRIKQSKVVNLSKVVGMLNEHAQDLSSFLTDDPKGNQIPGYLSRLSERLISEQSTVIQELDSLHQNIEHIKEIVVMQQSYAKISGVIELVNVTNLIDDALRMDGGKAQFHGIEIVRTFEEIVSIETEKHKVLQILINLIRNAERACEESDDQNKTVMLRTTRGDNSVRIEVSDNGVGIPEENLTRIFNHGFTTRKNGHGFGLHGGALAAKELGGSLNVQSDGLGKGAVFTLELPLKPQPRGREARSRTQASMLKSQTICAV